MLSVHSNVWALMYFRNAKLFHRSSSMILVGCLLVKKRAMAAPKRMDWFLMSSGLNPSPFSPPPILQHKRIVFSVNSLMIAFVLTSGDADAQMNVSWLALGTNCRTLRMALPKQRIGQSDLSSVQHWVLFSNFSPFFWSLNVMVM